MSGPKRILLWLMASLYVLAGFNHLIDPEFYLAIIPPQLPNPEWLNLASGLAEIVLGVALLEPRCSNARMHSLATRSPIASLMRRPARMISG